MQFGDRAADGIGFETRSSLIYRAQSDISLGIETYAIHGSTKDLDLFGRRFQTGAFAEWSLAGGWSVFTSALFGMNDQSPETELRLFISRRL